MPCCISPDLYLVGNNKSNIDTTACLLNRSRDKTSILKLFISPLLQQSWDTLGLKCLERTMACIPCLKEGQKALAKACLKEGKGCML